jgi:hypothetical protein
MSSRYDEFAMFPVSLFAMEHEVSANLLSVWNTKYLASLFAMKYDILCVSLRYGIRYSLRLSSLWNQESFASSSPALLAERFIKNYGN